MTNKKKQPTPGTVNNTAGGKSRISTESLAKRPSLKTPTPKIDKARALKLRLENGLTYQAIADIFNVSRSAVYQALKKYSNATAEDLLAFRENKASIMEFHQARLLDLTDKDIKSMSAAQRITAAAILYDKIRLERDQSTANVSSFSRIVGKACEQKEQEAEVFDDD